MALAAAEFLNKSIVLLFSGQPLASAILFSLFQRLRYDSETFTSKHVRRQLDLDVGHGVEIVIRSPCWITLDILLL